MKKNETCKCGCNGNCKECKCKKGQKTQNKTSKAVLVTVVLLLVFSVNLCFGKCCNAKPGLLIISHGAPWPAWNEPVLKLEQDVIKQLGDESPFCKVKVVFMEFAKPSVADGVKELEDAQCSRIVAVPLMIAPSSHSHWDIPALLGLYSDAEMEEELKKEGATIIRSKLAITITPTLADSDVIEKVMLKRVKELSNDPNNEAVVLVAHGDHMTGVIWDDFMKRTVTYICGHTNISYGDWACVEMGQGYDNAANVIAPAGKARKKVIVVGAYLSMGVDNMHKRWMEKFDAMGKSMPGLENPLTGIDVVLSKAGLLHDEAVAKWIADIAKAEIQRNDGVEKN